ncbi:methyltransferase domain-containing protein [Kovacikia minuta CCNUW1]|uniref:class I SAM-dependent methyltransferase n=1 Tax=Kovacikia minuta TaxID=2931930 RepID=UPI001CCEB0B6|nr:methyltransferase domain-containing protein [Kovacikia minuta]UBF27577.1 methyltransferase domain-containing protein [Kovacikia minuta CCNUW1]
MLPSSPEDWSDKKGWEDYWRKILVEDEWLISKRLLQDTGYFDSVDHFKSEGIKSILFLGCGISQAPKFFAFRGLQATGLDISETAINFAVNYVFEYEKFYQWFNSNTFKVNKQVWLEFCSISKKVSYECGSILDPNVAKETFDLVIATKMLQGYCREQSKIREVLECIDQRLRCNGKLLIFTINAPSAREMIDNQLTAMGYNKIMQLSDSKSGKSFLHMLASA